MEHNQNPFATAEAAWPAPSTPTPALPAAPAPVPEPSSPLDFEPVAVEWRSAGWTPERQRAFIEELADCGVVREAAARVGMTEQSAYRLRRRAGAEAFSIAWEAALQIGVDRLRSVAYERAIVGTPRSHYYHGEKVGEDRVYSDRLLIYLLSRQQQPCNAGAAHAAIPEWDRWMEAIEHGVPKPMRLPDETTDSPVWERKDGSWWTSFAPPPGFQGEQLGEVGERDYQRSLSPEELESLKIWVEGEEREKGRRRDAYFTRMKRNFSPPYTAEHS
jgi:hypothetical protein